MFPTLLVSATTLFTVLLAAPPAEASPTNPTVKYCKNQQPGLRIGDTGDCVKAIQTFLKFAVGGRDHSTLCPTFQARLQPPLEITSTFDSQTRRFLKCYQEWQGRNPTGVANRGTYAAMLRTCREDSAYRGIPRGDPEHRDFSGYWFCDRSAQSVYLTFDDGPVPRWTAAVLDILDEKGVSATFFVLGWRTEVYPHLARDVFERGHSVQSHAFGHADLTTLSDHGIRGELDRTSRAVKATTGRWPTCLRPPFGSTNRRVNAVAAEFGLDVIIWNRNSADYAGQTPSAIIRESAKWQGGDVVLAHDTLGYVWDDILATIIDQVRDRGLEFDRMCRNPGKRPN